MSKLVSVLLVGGSSAFVGDSDKVEKKMESLIQQYENDGWIRPELVIRNQRGYAVQLWLTHKTRLNAKNLPAKLSVGIQHAESV